MTLGSLEVIKPGLLTSVQDLGRYGHQAVGVPVAGPMDVFSHLWPINWWATMPQRRPLRSP